MRQASWSEVFRGRERQAELATQRPSRFSLLLRISQYTGITWETLVTLAIVLLGFFVVVRSIDRADWVAGMPSLYAIGFLGLLLGFAAAHARVSALTLHAGSAAVG